VPVPQTVSIVTIGARDLASLRSFYTGWGWSETEDASDFWTAFDVGGWLLSLYPIDALGNEAAPDALAPSAGWNGITFAINLQSEADLASVFDAAVAAGAQVITPVTRREWGGISGYVADPEGNRWELAVGSAGN
jgi:catechol 2,3-dioxygenase-like lactoylglutathione lyase family enzyme